PCEQGTHRRRDLPGRRARELTGSWTDRPGTEHVRAGLYPNMSMPDVLLPTAHIEIWSDIACPWCYIGKRRFAEALESFDDRDRIEVTWRSYQLSPDTPVGRRVPEVEALVAMKGMPAEQVRQM